jgi:tRNA threonylcarbamoyladenosine biosynthesis protein TsaB
MRWRSRLAEAARPRVNRLTSNSDATIIAIEASSQRCSVALAHAGSIRALAADEAHRNTESVPALVRHLLAEQDLPLAAVDVFAFAAGPGGFTGLRVACAFAQGLAYGCGRPVLAVGSLRALAHAAGQGPGTRLLAAVDARMGQVYWGAFEAGDEGPRALAPAAVADPDQLGDLVARWQPDMIVGDALAVHASSWPERTAARRHPQLRADAAAVAALAQLDWAAGLAVDARDAAPDYVRDQVALTVEERRAAARAAAALPAKGALS